VDYSDATYYGQPAGYRGKRAFFRLGNIEIELVELFDGKTIHEDFLKEHGEGLHHIGFQVESLGESVSNAEQAGFQVTQGFSRPDGSGFAYLDSDKTGGVIFELIQPPPEVKEN
jgi:methylmalonyl-CoA/ethylmalonyl-CoA epimerase